MIGVNQNGYAPKKLKEVMDKENLTWRTFADRDPGAISDKWNAGPATYYIIDAKGLIRYRPGPVAKDIDAALEKLIQEAGEKDPPKPLPKSLLETWTDAGAEVCWLRVDELGFLKVVPQQEGKPGDLPGFNIVRWQEGRVAKLPVPDAAFGLHLGRTEVTDAGLKELTRFKSLQALSVDVTKVTDVGLKELAGLQRLQSLSLDFTKVTDAGLKELAGFKSLHTLNLNLTQVTDAGLKELAALESLQSLNLSYTQVTDAGLVELAGLKRLHTLNLAGANVTDAGLAELGKALPDCKITR